MSMAGIAELAEKAGVAETLVVLFVRAMRDELCEGGTVRLKGLGTLRTRLREARMVTTPVLAEPVPKPAERVVVWKTSKKLRAELEVTEEEEAAAV